MCWSDLLQNRGSQRLVASFAQDVSIHGCQIDWLAPDCPAHSLESDWMDWSSPGDKVPVAGREGVGPHDIRIPA